MLDPKTIKPFNEVMAEENNDLQSGNIEDAFSLFNVYQERIQKNGMLGEKSLYGVLDSYTSGIIQGKVYTIGAFSNIGKSRFAYSYVQDFLKRGKKVLFFSLEVDIGMLFGNIAGAYYETPFTKVKNKINIQDFKNLKLYDKIYKMDEIKTITEKESPDVIFIDYEQSVQSYQSSEYERITHIAIEIQQLAIKNNITVFNLSQVNNDSRFKDGENITLKGSGQIFASSDVIFILNRDAKLLTLTIAKNKFGPALKKFIINNDFNLCKFTLVESLENDVTV